MSIERKVAIITGASQGLGAELVRAYRNRNYRVVANSRSIAPSRDSDVLAVAGDIADPATAERVITTWRSMSPVSSTSRNAPPPRC